MRNRTLDVSVVGELNLDLILYGLPEDMEPEREHLADRLALTLGSSSAIFAHNLARLGSRVGFISRIGDDPLGAISLERLSVGRGRCLKGPQGLWSDDDRADRHTPAFALPAHPHLSGDDVRDELRGP